MNKVILIGVLIVALMLNEVQLRKAASTRTTTLSPRLCPTLHPNTQCPLVTFADPTNTVIGYCSIVVHKDFLPYMQHVVTAAQTCKVQLFLFKSYLVENMTDPEDVNMDHGPHEIGHAINVFITPVSSTPKSKASDFICQRACLNGSLPQDYTTYAKCFVDTITNTASSNPLVRMTKDGSHFDDNWTRIKSNRAIYNSYRSNVQTNCN